MPTTSQAEIGANGQGRLGPFLEKPVWRLVLPCTLAGIAAQLEPHDILPQQVAAGAMDLQGTGLDVPPDRLARAAQKFCSAGDSYPTSADIPGYVGDL
jgi:hypothetical protein